MPDILHLILIYGAVPAVILIWAWRRFLLRKSSRPALFVLSAGFAVDYLIVVFSDNDSVNYLVWLCENYGFRSLWLAATAFACLAVDEVAFLRSKFQKNEG